MLGYVRADRWVLRRCDEVVYRAFYCGVCRALGARCGQRVRLALSYDVVFLALVADALQERGAVVQPGRCAAHPGRRLAIAGGAALDWAADVHALLLECRIQDELLEGGARGKLLRAAVDGKLNGAKARLPELTLATQTLFCRQAELERGGGLSGTVDAVNADFTPVDEAAQPFCDFLGAIAGQLPGLPDEFGSAAVWLGENLGRWIYWVDALDDYEKDKKRRKFNPLLPVFPTREAAASAMRVPLEHCAAQSELAMRILPLRRHEALIRNILVDGLMLVTEQVCSPEGTKRNRKSESARLRAIGDDGEHGKDPV